MVPATSASKLTVLRYLLAFIGGLVGFAVIGGSLGVVLGIGLVLVGSMLWSRKRAGSRPDPTPQALHEANAVLASKVSMTSRIMGVTVLSFGISFLLYSISLSVVHDSRADIEWAERFQPIGDLLSTFVPSLRRMPLSLIERGEAEWAPAVQNVLFLGWLFSPMLAGWIAFDVLVINRHFWGRNALLITGWGWGILILISAAIIAAMLPNLFFGLTLGLEPRKIRAASGLPVLAVLFLLMLFAFFMLTASCNALLRRSGIGGQAIPPDPRESDRLHDFLHDAFAGRIIERIFVARRDRVEREKKNGMDRKDDA